MIGNVISILTRAGEQRCPVTAHSHFGGTMVWTPICIYLKLFHLTIMKKETKDAISKYCVNPYLSKMKRLAKVESNENINLAV